MTFTGSLSKGWLALAWALFYVVFTYWFEAAIMPLASAYWLLVIPITEEYVKFVCYRLMSRYTIVIPLAAVVAEGAMRLYDAMPTLSIEQAGSALSVMAFMWAMMLLIGKHILMWAPGYLSRFRFLSLPAMMLVHGLWNQYWDAGEPVIAAVLALVSLSLMLILMRENKSPLVASMEKHGAVIIGAVFASAAYLIAILHFAVKVFIAIANILTWLRYWGIG